MDVHLTIGQKSTAETVYKMNGSVVFTEREGVRGREWGDEGQL